MLSNRCIQRESDVVFFRKHISYTYAGSGEKIIKETSIVRSDFSDSSETRKYP